MKDEIKEEKKKKKTNWYFHIDLCYKGTETEIEQRKLAIKTLCNKFGIEYDQIKMYKDHQIEFDKDPIYETIENEECGCCGNKSLVRFLKDTMSFKKGDEKCLLCDDLLP